jgi:hypothetical protein
VLGNATILSSAGICESCSTTPKKIKEDLSVSWCSL